MAKSQVHLPNASPTTRLPRIATLAPHPQKPTQTRIPAPGATPRSRTSLARLPHFCPHFALIPPGQGDVSVQHLAVQARRHSVPADEAHPVLGTPHDEIGLGPATLALFASFAHGRCPRRPRGCRSSLRPLGQVLVDLVGQGRGRVEAVGSWASLEGHGNGARAKRRRRLLLFPRLGGDIAQEFGASWTGVGVARGSRGRDFCPEGRLWRVEALVDDGGFFGGLGGAPGGTWGHAAGDGGAFAAALAGAFAAGRVDEVVGEDGAGFLVHGAATHQARVAGRFFRSAATVVVVLEKLVSLIL